MTDIAIQVENLAKRYRIGRKLEVRDGRRTLWSKAGAPFRYLADTLRQPGADEILWALKDVSFEVKQGEVLGVIGRNGAGKSTLLKILARITEPTGGRAVINGRVGSLLEVGTGFHPELTGRENIFLNGAILGMRRAEVERKFDEIVDFAEVEKFIDTPVKHYSSGMYVRLAFAVAAQLEPEILLVDEVLAVGDAAFQRKCLGKMGSISREGRAILFVSHNLIAVQTLCQKAICLDNGSIILNGLTENIIPEYLKTSLKTLTQSEQIWEDMLEAPGTDTIKIHRLCVQPGQGKNDGLISTDNDLDLEIEFWNLDEDAELHVTLQLYNDQGIAVLGTSNYRELEKRKIRLNKGLYKTICKVPRHFLNSGVYRVNILFVRDASEVEFRYDEGLTFEIVDLKERKGHWFGKPVGVVRPELDWSTELLGENGQRTG